MNALQTLLWVEWKKSGSKVSLLMGLLGIGSIVLISKGATGVGMTAQIMVLTLLYLVGMFILSLLSFQIGTDFKSDQFHPLLLSPVSPWLHLSARTGFQLVIALIYYLLLSGLSVFVFAPKLDGNVLQMSKIIIFTHLYFIVAIILPGNTQMLFLSMVGTSFRNSDKGQKITVFMLVVASLIWFGKAFDAAMEIGGQYLPVIKLKLPGTMIHQLATDVQINFWMIRTNEDNGGLFFIDRGFPLYLEPLLMILAICLLLIFLSTRIWEEVER